MLVVFDLDFTLWDCGGTWCDHTNPPYYKHNGVVLDEDQRKIRLYPEVRKILEDLREQNILLGIASRTGAPDWAEELMDLLDIKKYFDYFEIYPGSKINHFRSLQNKTRLRYRDMVFFDDEYRNIQEVGQLGVQAVFVENGMHSDLLNGYFI